MASPRISTNTMVMPSGFDGNSSVQEVELGTRAVDNCGRAYRYVKVGGTALVPGKLYQSAATTTGWQDLDVATTAVGAVKVTTVSTITATANQLAGGYLAVTNGTGAGYFYKISGNTAASGAVSTITLAEPVQVQIAATDDVDLIMNPWAEIELWDNSNHYGVAVGVAQFPVTAEYYGWVQVAGPANVLIDEGNGVVGEEMDASDDTDGAVGLSEGTFFPTVGVAMTASSSGEYGLVNLSIS